MAERIAFITPVGESKYPYIQQPDTAFGQNKYKTSLVLKKADAEPLVEKSKVKPLPLEKKPIKLPFI